MDTIKYFNTGSSAIAELQSAKVIIKDTQDALDLMADCGYHGASRIIVYEHNLNPAFFDLKTRLAGEILQKFSNYRVRLAVVGDFSKYNSKSLRDFMRESNKSGRIIFVSTPEEAKEKLNRS